MTFFFFLWYFSASLIYLLRTALWSAIIHVGVDSNLQQSGCSSYLDLYWPEKKTCWLRVWRSPNVFWINLRSSVGAAHQFNPFVSTHRTIITHDTRFFSCFFSNTFVVNVSIGCWVQYAKTHGSLANLYNASDENSSVLDISFLPSAT